MIETPGATPTTPTPSSDAAMDPGDVRPVEVVVEVVDGVVVVAEVPAVDVVDVAVAVVVDAVGLLAVTALAGVRPGARGEVRMAEVDPVVDDRHDRAGRPGRDRECLRGVDVGVERCRRSRARPGRCPGRCCRGPTARSSTARRSGRPSRKRRWSTLTRATRGRPAARRWSRPRRRPGMDDRGPGDRLGSAAVSGRARPRAGSTGGSSIGRARTERDDEAIRVVAGRAIPARCAPLGGRGRARSSGLPPRGTPGTSSRRPPRGARRRRRTSAGRGRGVMWCASL